LLEAVIRGSEVVGTLIKAGANVNAGSEGEITPLIIAAAEGHIEIVKALLDAGADVNAKDYNSRTALMMAKAQEHAEIADLLKRAGATEAE
jgi:ankyrin repeat protein